jgi:hypothetical protein
MQVSAVDRGVVRDAVEENPSSNTSGVSWAAVFAGAAGAASLSYILVILGFGLGLSSISPWGNEGASASTMGLATILWLAFTQIAASAMGGYLAGRLRVKWVGVHTDEVYFRDTAHGFLSWAVASLVVAAFLASTMAAVIGGGASMAGSTLKGAATAASAAVGSAAGQAGAGNGDPTGYFADALLRTDPGAATAPDPGDATTRIEVARIFANDAANGTLTAEDKTYLGQVVAKKTGLAPPQAEQKVDAAFGQLKGSVESATAKAKQAADDARKAAAKAALWTFIALLAGAFFASFAATFGGRQRDSFPVTSARTVR